jgi:hypothetical protein
MDAKPLTETKRRNTMADKTEKAVAQFTKGQKLAVFSIRELKDGKGKSGSIWVRAGRAFVNGDGSLNLMLDVLPLDGRLHVRVDAKPEPKPESSEAVAA